MRMGEGGLSVEHGSSVAVLSEAIVSHEQARATETTAHSDAGYGRGGAELQIGDPKSGSIGYTGQMSRTLGRAIVQRHSPRA